MPVDVALNKLGADHQALIPASFRRRKHAQLSACLLAVAIYAVTLAGCDRTGRGATVSSTANTYIATSAGSRTPIPLPGRTLLNPQPEPDCELQTTEPKTDDLRKLACLVALHVRRYGQRLLVLRPCRRCNTTAA